MNQLTKKEKPKYGICPFMSQTIIAPAEAVGNITPVGSNSLTTLSAQSPCLGTDCQIFDNDVKRCSVVSTPYLTNAFETLAKKTNV